MTTVQTHAEHKRLTQMLLELDEQEDLSPEDYAMPRVAPNESLKALMEDRELKHKDIWPVLGNKGTATEILAGRRAISKAQARRLADFLRVPVEIFV